MAICVFNTNRRLRRGCRPWPEPGAARARAARAAERRQGEPADDGGAARGEQGPRAPRAPRRGDLGVGFGMLAWVFVA